MSFAAYAVAIKLNLVDGLSPALTGISKLLLANNAHATELEKRLHSISSMLKTGALMTGAGFGLAWAMKAATGEAVKYEQQLNRLKALNLGGPATANLTSLADQIARGTRGTSQREALRLVTETQSITGDVGHTRELTPEGVGQAPPVASGHDEVHECRVESRNVSESQSTLGGLG